jgi:CheY-like chemotaxis protein
MSVNEMSANTRLRDDPSAIARAWRRSRIQGRRILYVDDERLMRLAVARLLRSAGAVCVGADTHAGAVVRLALEPTFDLAILDFQMPDGDVGQLARRLLRQQPGLTLVGTSASDRRSEFAARGVDRFLPKPWDLDDLLRTSRCPAREATPIPAGSGAFESTGSAQDLPDSGDTRGLSSGGRLTSGSQPIVRARQGVRSEWSR